VRNRGYREECGSIVVAGSGILSEVCGGVAGVDGVGSALTLFLAEDADVPPGVTARRIVRAPEHVLKKAAGLQSVDRVDAVAELSMPPVVGVGALTEAGRITRLLALDGIQDPGNLGTLVRTALALGWDAVALLPGTCDPYNDKVRDFAPVARVDAIPSDTVVHSIFKPGTARFVTLSGWTPRRPIALPVLYIYFTCETKPSF
jgi:TrmH family RNA methyltransferase